MSNYEVYKYDGNKITTYTIVVDGPYAGEMSLNKLLTKYGDMANLTNFVYSLITKYFGFGSYDEDVLDILLSNEITRKKFISLYLDKYESEMSEAVINNERFVLDFRINVNKMLPNFVLNKLPKGKEYLISLDSSPNILGLFLKRYFPNDMNAMKLVESMKGVASKDKLLDIIEDTLGYSSRNINKIMYNVAKYNKGYTKLEDFLANNVLENFNHEHEYDEYVESGRIDFNIYSLKGIDRVSIILPSGTKMEGNNLYNLIRSLLEMDIKKVIKEWIQDKKSIRGVMKLVDKMSYNDKWYYISYALYSIRSTIGLSHEDKEDLLNVLYDERVLFLPNIQSSFLEELKLKTKLDRIDEVINNGEGSKEVIYYLLYKLLNKLFPNNKIYWLRRLDSTRLDTTKFIEKGADWETPLINLNIVDLPTTKGVLTFLISDYYDLKTDISGFNSLEEYYNSILDVFNTVNDLTDRHKIRKVLTNYRN